MRRRKGVYWKAGFVVAVVLLAVAKPYSSWKGERFTERAANSLASGNPSQAALEARVALAADDSNSVAVGHLAEAYEKLNDRRLLPVLEQLTGDKGTLRYARAALAFGEIDLAKQSLAEFHPSATEEVVEYSKLGILWAEMAKDSGALFTHLEALARANADSEAGESALLKLAGLVALSGNMTMPDDLYAQLKEWAGRDDALSLDANVLLWAMASRDPNVPVQSSRFLDRLKITDSDSPEVINLKSAAQIRAMDFAVAFEDDAWMGLLSGLQQRVTEQRDPTLSGVVLQWMHRHQQYTETVDAAKRSSASLEPTPEDDDDVVRRIVLARILVADACARINDWQGVGRWCEGPPWGSHEYLRSLLIARALSGASTDSIPVPAARWLRLAVGQALENPADLKSLELAARTYGPRGLWIELHRGIASRSTDNSLRTSSLAIIKKVALESGNLVLFREASEQLAELIPDDWGDRHNALFAATLMDTVPASTVSALTELRSEQPDSVDVAVSLSLALARTGDLEKAVQVLAVLDQPLLAAPGIAPFCAIVYALAGDVELSRKYADKPAELHFPESQRLLTQAMTTLEANG
ncbi:MAG: hypothetical protein KDN22_26215 [Verrucomicrobiae bacterium]|nr:hypothetical protein [Verrucomicrobiae bacterium]